MRYRLKTMRILLPILLLSCFLSNQAFAARFGSRVIRFVPKRQVVKRVSPVARPVAKRETPKPVPPPLVVQQQASLVEAVTPKRAGFPGVLGIALGVKSPLSQQLLMGSADNILAVFALKETIGGDITLNEITLIDNIGIKGAMTSWIMPSFTNLALWQDNKKISNSSVVTNNDSFSYKIVFPLVNPVVIGPNQSINLTLRGDVLPAISSQVTDNSTHIFKILSGTYFADAKPITVVANKLKIDSAPLGVVMKRPRNNNDELASIRFNIANDNSMKINKMILTFKSDSLTVGQTISADLDDFYLGNNIAHSQCVINEKNSCSMLFLLGIDVSKNSNIVLKLRFNSYSLTNNPDAADSLLVTINEAIDVDWNNNAPLEATVVPVTIAKISYD